MPFFCEENNGDCIYSANNGPSYFGEHQGPRENGLLAVLLVFSALSLKPKGFFQGDFGRNF